LFDAWSYRCQRVQQVCIEVAPFLLFRWSQTRRPVTNWTMRTITATTSRRWIRLPAIWRLKPRSHSTTSITRIVQSIQCLQVCDSRLGYPRRRPTIKIDQTASELYSMRCHATEMSGDEQSEGAMVLTNPAPLIRIYLHRSQNQVAKFEIGE